MKLHFTNWNPGIIRKDLLDMEHKLHEKEERWMYYHSWMLAVLLACLIAGLIVSLLGAIDLYITTGSWPLFN